MLVGQFVYVFQLKVGQIEFHCVLVNDARKMRSMKGYLL